MDFGKYFGEVLKTLRTLNDLTQVELAQKLGMSDAAINRYEKGLREPKHETLVKIADFFGVSISVFFPKPDFMHNKDLLRDLRIQEGLTIKELSKLSKIPVDLLEKYETGEEELDMYALKIIIESMAEGFDFSDVINEFTDKKDICPNYKDLVELYKGQKLLTKDDIMHGAGKSNSHSIPLLGSIAAGEPILAQENILGYVEDVNKGDYALFIKGDSMEPRIFEGDIVIIDKEADISNNDIVVALINGEEAICKKYKKVDEGIMLISLNNKYDPKFFSKKDIKTLPIQILGKVVELRAKL